uniref:Uncharacterized protein n=1 Tax=Strongyloides venezuelensis TaxID=75913 RepID=A0A0K0EUV7_STRVS
MFCKLFFNSSTFCNNDLILSLSLSIRCYILLVAILGLGVNTSDNVVCTSKDSPYVVTTVVGSSSENEDDKEDLEEDWKLY